MIFRYMTILAFLPVLLCFTGKGAAGDIKILTGRVVKVLDGDSFIMKSGREKHEIRMWGIDCPEYKQPYSSHAKSVSRRLMEKKKVRVEVKYYDKYDRGIGMVYRNGLKINEELVRLGAAWVYGRYCGKSICREWEQIEKKAREQKLGLWRGSNPVPPWQWRQKKG